MYRTQTYVERCHCDGAAVASCSACGRARCASHLERSRCDRCMQRCHCDVAAVAPCAACGRARCANHLERSLCNRCTQWIGREFDGLASRRAFTAGAVGVATTLGMLIGHLAFGVFVGLPLAIPTYFVHAAWQRRRLIRTMGPTLAASNGELSASDRTITFWPSAGDNVPYGGEGG